MIQGFGLTVSGLLSMSSRWISTNLHWPPQHHVRVPRRHETGWPDSQVHLLAPVCIRGHFRQRWSTDTEDTPRALVCTRLGPGGHWPGRLRRLPARWPAEITRIRSATAGLDAFARSRLPRRVAAARRRHAQANTPHPGLAGGSAQAGPASPRPRAGCRRMAAVRMRARRYDRTRGNTHTYAGKRMRTALREQCWRVCVKKYLTWQRARV